MSEEKSPYGSFPVEQGEQNYIRDEASSHNWRTELPNMIDEMGLSVYAYRLYGHLKKVAGDGGACWQGTRTLAKACNMGTGSIVRAKKELASTNPPLIRIEIKDEIFHYITITDIWAINFASHGKSQKPETQEGVPTGNGCSHGERGVPLGNGRCSPGELKKNPLKKNPLRKKNNPSPFFSSKIDHFPADTREIIQEVTRLWMLDIPENKNGKTRRFQEWIDGARELKSACAEFGTPILNELFINLQTEATRHGGVPPFLPSGPKGLINPISGYVSWKRRRVLEGPKIGTFRAGDE